MVSKGDPFGVIESVKAVSDLYAPVSGEVVDVNADLAEHPEAVNEDCYGDGWMIAIAVSERGRARIADGRARLPPARRRSQRLDPIRIAEPRLRYIPHTEADVEQMLEAIGVGSLEALFASVPQKHRLQRPLAVPAAASEQELVAELTALAARNAHHASHDWFLGAGSYAHFIPSAVDAIASRSEFFTAYTPYQPEISQGTLQAIFEWQTMICGLTGLEVSNASMYDGASAAAEAALMAMRITRRSKVVLADGVHPHYREVIQTYLGGLEASVVAAPRAAGRPDRAAGRAGRSPRRPAWSLQQPNFWGSLEDVAAAAAAARAHGAQLVVVVTEALSLALLRPPGALRRRHRRAARRRASASRSASAARTWASWRRAWSYVRQLPGRLVGQTVDGEGRRGFVLTLSTREQHIRRERATSNICTNQGLCLLMATVYLSLLGRVGLRRLAERNLAKAEYAKAAGARDAGALAAVRGADLQRVRGRRARRRRGRARARAATAGIVGGLDLAPYAPELGPRGAGLHDRARDARRRSTGWSARWREPARERRRAAAPRVGNAAQRLLLRGAAALRAQPSGARRLLAARLRRARRRPGGGAASRGAARRPRRAAGALRGGRDPPLHAALDLERRGRPRPLSARLLHDEVQPEDQREDRPTAGLRGGAPAAARAPCCRASSQLLPASSSASSPRSAGWTA